MKRNKRYLIEKHPLKAIYEDDKPEAFESDEVNDLSIYATFTDMIRLNINFIKSIFTNNYTIFNDKDET